MATGTLPDEIRSWRWVAHSVLEGLLVVTLLCTAGPLTLLLVDGGSVPIVPEDPVSELLTG